MVFVSKNVNHFHGQSHCKGDFKSIYLNGIKK